MVQSYWPDAGNERKGRGAADSVQCMCCVLPRVFFILLTRMLAEPSMSFANLALIPKSYLEPYNKILNPT